MKLLENVPLLKQLEIINRLNFFNEFTLSERQVLLESFSHLYLVHEKHHAFKRFELDNRLFIVLSGEFIIFKKSQLLELGRVGPGEFIGEGAFICHKEHSTSAKALKDSILLAITPEAMTRLPNVIREKVKDKIIEGMSARISTLSNFIEDNI
ncbi:cyclic nucleotide-binding domain-containing protein [Pseudoalteromonas sp. MMG013]|uniref:cyclic nucleotide-binding domain-containing protein n=1 Tax=unclassified Pseudoalteromonas TaxID=194690 RepID=UPI001B360BDE|nr:MULTISPECIES: cyclic nucleotide-binding domain-containing protein [unclassified Pseudoalteromonas]MBQ4850712.1 cyclic nucleotide-binding domain-containing protein [Pseudoalteromonas sp. MMG012]MBQ4862691.1 cyclic nucleotide-binding domain-containing protein [Pseudoalteromonas sp. MMG013]